MTETTQLFVGAVVLASLLGMISIWSPRHLLIKATALVTTVLFLPVAYAAMTELLSKPKPISLEWLQGDASEADVLASRMVEGEGIFLWLQLSDLEEPRSYVMPWNQENAEKLQEAMREAEEQGSSVRMRNPFEPSLDDAEPKFYALPQPALPPKDLAEPPPEVYEHPGQDA
ncbi:MAG: hypothetical protein ACFB6S_14610 [Geminicoccaceae bacterium]